MSSTFKQVSAGTEIIFNSHLQDCVLRGVAIVNSLRHECLSTWEGGDCVHELGRYYEVTCEACGFRNHYEYYEGAMGWAIWHNAKRHAEAVIANGKMIALREEEWQQ
jgi:hypothetical protein